MENISTHSVNNKKIHSLNFNLLKNGNIPSFIQSCLKKFWTETNLNLSKITSWGIDSLFYKIYIWIYWTDTHPLNLQSKNNLLNNIIEDDYFKKLSTIERAKIIQLILKKIDPNYRDDLKIKNFISEIASAQKIDGLERFVNTLESLYKTFWTDVWKIQWLIFLEKPPYFLLCVDTKNQAIWWIAWLTMFDTRTSFTNLFPNTNIKPIFWVNTMKKVKELIDNARLDEIIDPNDNIIQKLITLSIGWKHSESVWTNWWIKKESQIEDGSMIWWLLQQYYELSGSPLDKTTIDNWKLWRDIPYTRIVFSFLTENSFNLP